MNRSCWGPVEYDRVFVFYFQYNEKQFAVKFKTLSLKVCKLDKTGLNNV